MHLAPRPERIAIVGGGPRAAYALERLVTLGSSHGIDPPEVDVIAPGKSLGPGEIYTDGQPEWLRLNVASTAVDAWHTSDTRNPGPSFDDWRELRGLGSSRDKFPSRVMAGRYLEEFGADARGLTSWKRITPPCEFQNTCVWL